MARQRLTLPPIFNQRSKDQGHISSAVITASTAPFFLCADLSANGTIDFLPSFAPTNVPKDQERMTTAITPASTAPFFLYAD